MVEHRQPGVNANEHLLKGAVSEVSSAASLGLLHSQILPDVSGQCVVNLGVPWHRLFLAGPRIGKHVVSRTGTHHATTIPKKLSDEFPALHTAIAFS
jgi:hypothetical protein